MANGKQLLAPETSALANIEKTPGPGVIPNMNIAIKKVIAL